MAGLLIFWLVLFSHLLQRLVLLVLPRGKQQAAEQRIMKEIRDLQVEANAMSSPSTFAKAAKLRRAAAMKEKELALLQQSFSGKSHPLKMVQIIFSTLLKAITFCTLCYWFWGVPVACVPSVLLQPLGDALSWRTRDYCAQGSLMIGIVPWLVISTRISTFLSGKIHASKGN